jgi:hypothetical protein
MGIEISDHSHLQGGAMLLNPMAVNKLNNVTRIAYYPYTTHYLRNEATRAFLKEAGRLLDQQAESTVKHAIELYTTKEISYEQYLEIIERVSNEEAVRGAAYGGEYARNRVFDFAQTILDQAKEQAHELALLEAKKQYEREKQKTEQSLKEVVQHYLAEMQTMTERHDAELKTITQEQKEELVLNQGEIIERTKAAVDQMISTRLQEETSRREQELQEAEALRPAREAARTATEHVAALERKIRMHQWLRTGLAGLGVVCFVALVIILLFFSLPQWGTVIALAVIASILVSAFLWKSPIPEDKVAAYRREIACYQTKSDDYAPLSEEERCSLLVQRIL